MVNIHNHGRGSGGKALSSWIYETVVALTINRRADVDGGSSKLMISQEMLALAVT
jgi:hypothetical protein